MLLPRLLLSPCLAVLFANAASSSWPLREPPYQVSLFNFVGRLHVSFELTPATLPHWSSLSSVLELTLLPSLGWRWDLARLQDHPLYRASLTRVRRAVRALVSSVAAASSTLRVLQIGAHKSDASDPVFGAPSGTRPLGGALSGLLPPLPPPAPSTAVGGICCVTCAPNDPRGVPACTDGGQDRDGAAAPHPFVHFTLQEPNAFLHESLTQRQRELQAQHGYAFDIIPSAACDATHNGFAELIVSALEDGISPATAAHVESMRGNYTTALHHAWVTALASVSLTPSSAGGATPSLEPLPLYPSLSSGLHHRAPEVVLASVRSGEADVLRVPCDTLHTLASAAARLAAEAEAKAVAIGATQGGVEVSHPTRGEELTLLQPHGGGDVMMSPGGGGANHLMSPPPPLSPPHVLIIDAEGMDRVILEQLLDGAMGRSARGGSPLLPDILVYEVEHGHSVVPLPPGSTRDTGLTPLDEAMMARLIAAGYTHCAQLSRGDVACALHGLLDS